MTVAKGKALWLKLHPPKPDPDHHDTRAIGTHPGIRTYANNTPIEPRPTVVTPESQRNPWRERRAAANWQPDDAA